ncbi:hypothetical protein QJS10_CPA06g02305 [Acorus calamus]|uniref:BZIP domain-containing protein n=1 Tax=Acorus calamus TaxID=4465 RepID=A0AAV9EQ49_ACOCL|nr:hypothetical protein QJS10_CPA06g02305 [Acorus calamus]
MGTGEADTPTKSLKSSSTQAYYNPSGSTPVPPPGYFHSSVASSSQGPQYMWSTQMMPPYGTPPPFVTVYPHGGIYPHPSIPPVAAASSAEVEGKSVECKDGNTVKRSKGSLGSLNMLTGKNNDIGKASGVSGNDASSQSGDSGTEVSSEGSDANSENLLDSVAPSSNEESCAIPHIFKVQPAPLENYLISIEPSGPTFHRNKGFTAYAMSRSIFSECVHIMRLTAENGQNGSSVGGTSSEIANASATPTVLNQTMPLISVPSGGFPGPTTNLNIGMDYWGGTSASPISTRRNKLPIMPALGAIVPSNRAASRDGVPSEIWVLDEKELKRQRRKQSNRESARRSRLRKQAECEELAQRVGILNDENASLKDELANLREECEKLASENASLTERLQKTKVEESANGPPNTNSKTDRGH